jgi:hypothetical protein
MSGKKSRTKGHAYEREIARRLRPLFPGAMRNVTEQQTGGQGIDLVNTGNLDVQCKRYKGYAPINKIFEVNGTGIPVLVTKADRQPDMVVLSLKDFIAILGDVGVVYEGS